jgi:hypothetical protein
METIENARIVNVDLSMADHGVLCLALVLEGNGWGVTFGGRVLGKGYVGAKEFSGGPKGIEEIMRIMDVVGVSKFNDLKNKYVRVVIGNWGDTISKIGNIIQDKWFDYKEFYSDEGKL